MMHRLRYGDWICGIGAAALLVLLCLDDGWSDLGWLAIACAVMAIAAGLATPLLTILRQSPSAPLLATVVALTGGLATAVAMVVEGAGAELAAALVLVLGAYLGLHDERAPGAPQIPVERRPAPPASP
ncbi:MAG TPA: hypothetical protein VFB41_00425 [Solirubrobacteraceae bacterium]|nr:hypothetical protein [Solirubrobacteraceae bacterium]